MKIIKVGLVAAMISMAGLTGCASTHEDVAEHHHHEEKAQFEGKCAYSVSNGKYDVAGNPEYKLEHNGVSYYFSSKEAMSKFSAHADDSVKRANRAWGGRR